ncbi:MAG: decaprenyl-phosphate phosphoribosyltransferase [Microgenomates group bacterium]
MKGNIKIFSLLEALRPSQWIKNLSLFAAVILNGQLFNLESLVPSILAFVTFCFLSSSSYLVNDILDKDKDIQHPYKKNRPIARGDVSTTVATFASFFLLFTGLGIAMIISSEFFFISLLFIILQYSYSFFFKKKAVVDIAGISLFFIIRAFAGEIASGYHLPIWIMLTVIFLSLFIASGKRRSELINSGKKTRAALSGYGRSLLNFYTTMFAVCTLIGYSMYAFFEDKLKFQGIIHEFLLDNFPAAIDRKWYMLSIIPVIYGIMRYGQIIFEMQEGERPERAIATDIPLIISVLSWGLMIITIIYVL